MVTYASLRKNEAVNTYIDQADKSLRALGYTEHSFIHVTRVAETARKILQTLGFPERECELAAIAAYLHDIGNLVNRIDHSQSGALMSFRILDKLGMPPAEIAAVATAIGNHDEGTGVPVSPMAAALILADKSDVRRDRVRNPDPASFDIHDRVNYSVRESRLRISEDKTQIELSLIIDTHAGSVLDFFDIFMKRMQLCRKAAETLGMTLRLTINGQTIL